MSKQYSDITDVLVDIGLYAVIYNGGTLTLGMFPTISRNRWQWLVDNWNVYYTVFEADASGSDYTLRLLKDLNKEVQANKLGIKNNPLENINNFRKYQSLLDLILLEDIDLTPEEIKQRQERIRDVSEYSIDQLKIMSDYVRRFIAELAMDIGLGDEHSSQLLGINYSEKKREPTIQDMFYMDDLADIQQIIDGYIFNLRIADNKPPNLLRIANNNIDPASGISVNTGFISGAPTPFELSLEHMAHKYLNDKRRWYELVTVNNLQPPFVDEVGVKQLLLAPASKTTVIINRDYQEWFYPGCIVKIGSSRIKEVSVIIEKISENDEDSMVLHFNVNENVAKAKPSENGYIRVYHPHTVRKSSMILIPSEIASSNMKNYATPMNSELRRLEKAYINFGFDIYRNASTGDFQVNSNGYFKLAVGEQAIRQAILNAVKTQIGELSFHPNYGADLRLGDKYFGSLEEGVLYAQIIKNAVTSNPKISTVQILKLEATQSGVAMQIAVKIKGFDNFIPLAFVS